MRESIKETKGRIKAGSIVTYGCHVFGRDVCNIHRERKEKIIQDQSQAKIKNNNIYQNLVLKAKEVWNMKSDISKMKVIELRKILMPLRNKDDPGVKNKKYLPVQWNTWKHHHYRNVVDDYDDNDMVITHNDEDNSGPVDGGTALLLLDSANQELQQEIVFDIIIVTVNEAI